MLLSCWDSLRMGRDISKRRIFHTTLGRGITQNSCNVSFIVVKALDHKMKVLFLFNDTRFPEKCCLLEDYQASEFVLPTRRVLKWVWSTDTAQPKYSQCRHCTAEVLAVPTLHSRSTHSITWPNAIFPSKISQGVGRDVNPGLRGDRPAINRLSLSKVLEVSVHINNTSASTSYVSTNSHTFR
jgi:hypothetical protein